MRLALVCAVLGAVTAAAAWGGAETTNGEIFYLSGGRGTFVAADGSRSRSPRIGTGARAHYVGESGPVAFSPDGRRIAYTCSPNLCVENLNGTGRRRLTRAPRNTYVGDSDPAWSRDGKRIAFVRSLVVRNYPVYRIAVVNADGTGERLVPEPKDCRESHQSREPTWGPAGELLYVCTMNAVDKGPLIAVDPAKAAVPTPCRGLRPDFSPDGTRILVSEGFDINHNLVGLETFSAAARWDAETGLPEARCDWRRIGDDDHPFAVSAVWSPDGTAVAFLSDNQREIYVVRADGSGLRRIVRSRAEIDLEIAWLRK